MTPTPAVAVAPSSPPVRSPWLDGVIACTRRVEAEALLATLGERGLRPRSIPAGPARAAWNAVTPEGTALAVVLGGTGEAAARAVAGHWAPQARRLVVCGLGGGTGLVPAPAVVLDGDAGLSTRAGAALAGLAPAHAGRVASVTGPVTAEAALTSLAAAGIAAVDGEGDSWRLAATRLGVPVLICRGLDPSPIPPDPGGWRAAIAALGRLRPRRRTGGAGTAIAAAGPAARAAVAACLGPR